MKYMYPVRPTMTIIATTFLNLPFANQILDAFNEYSNEYEFTAEGIFRRINGPACPCCGKQMSHNGYNRYSILDLANIKLGKYICKKCKMSLQEENTFWEKMKFEFVQILTGLYQVLRNHDVSFEGVSEVMDYIIPQSRDTISRGFTDSVAGVQLPEDSPIQIVHYDEQHPKAGRSQKYRLTLLNGVSHNVIAEELSDNKTQEAIKQFFGKNLKDVIEKSTPIFIVTDLGKGYAELITDVFKGNAIHQYCLFHLNQIIAKEFSKQAPMKDELVKYMLFNIFYDREVELNYLRKVVEEEASINFRDEKEEKEWRKRAKIRFYGFLYEQELKRRRAHKNLRLRTYYESHVIMINLLDNAHTFSIIVQKRLEKIQKGWIHFTAFQRVDDAPATNNAIENYYSTSLKGQNKKQLRTDSGINTHMKLSSMKRFGMIGKPKITFLEAILKIIPFRAAG
jgi:hypothetical protein